MWRVVGPALILSLAACAATPRPAPLLAEEAAAVCGVVVQLRPSGTGISMDPGDAEALDALTKEWTFKDLPETIRCAGRRYRLAPRGDDYGDFVSAFAIGPDGRRLALTGGYQAAPLAGGGGYCVYERGAEGWRQIGCVHTWDS